MKLKPFKIIFSASFLFLLLFQGSGFSAGQTNKQQQSQSPQKYKEIVDKLVNSSATKLQYFTKLKGQEKPFKVQSPGYWPRDVEFNYSLFYDENDRLIYALKQAVPEAGGSLGWKLMYAYYFSPDAEGKTLAVHKFSTFFNNICAGNETITATDVSYFDKDFKPLARDYSMTTENGRHLDSLQCEPPYHFPNLHHYAPTRDAFLKENKFK